VGKNLNKSDGQVGNFWACLLGAWAQIGLNTFAFNGVQYYKIRLGHLTFKLFSP